MAMTPQPYPLWCAVLNPDGSITTGRIVGWEHVDTENFFGYTALPVIAAEDQHGRVTHINSPFVVGKSDDAEMFIRDTHGGAVVAAANYMRAAHGAEYVAARANHTDTRTP